MQPFAYARVDKASTAVERVTSDAGAKFLGGGTNLVDFMKLNVENRTSAAAIALTTVHQSIQAAGLR